MQKVLVAGAGKIGTLVAVLLANAGDYQVLLADTKRESSDSYLHNEAGTLRRVILDVTQPDKVKQLIKKESIQIVVACLPFFYNIELANLAKTLNLHYFDLTEDIYVSDTVKKLSKDAGTAFVPQCGVAPGFINIVANNMIQHFDQVDSVLLCAGAIPQQPHNALKYALTWSTDGLINEYANPCVALVNKRVVNLEPLEGLETIEIDGLLYEAFNTSGGIGTLALSYQDQINTMSYKTLRYPGHGDKVKFLLNDLKLKNDRLTLKHIFENAIPSTLQDVVVLYVSVKGYRDQKLVEESFVKKLYPIEIDNKRYSAIQIATASGLCAVLDIVSHHAGSYSGLVLQEDFSLHDILNNRFGQYFSTGNSYERR